MRLRPRPHPGVVLDITKAEVAEPATRTPRGTPAAPDPTSRSASRAPAVPPAASPLLPTAVATNSDASATIRGPDLALVASIDVIMPRTLRERRALPIERFGRVVGGLPQPAILRTLGWSDDGVEVDG
jgi:hypothetical protein